MKYLRLTLVLLASLTFASCAGKSVFQGGPSLTASINNPVTKDMIYDVENTLVVGVSGLLQYKNACAKKLIDQKCRPIVQKLQGYTRRAKPLLVSLRKFVRENDQINAIQVYNELRNILGQFQQTVAVNGVQ